MQKNSADWLSSNWYAEKVGRLVVDKLACRKSRQTGKSHTPAGALLNFHTAVILRRLVTEIESVRDLGVSVGYTNSAECTTCLDKCVEHKSMRCTHVISHCSVQLQQVED